mgnify:CR=1 FL=1
MLFNCWHLSLICLIDYQVWSSLPINKSLTRIETVIGRVRVHHSVFFRRWALKQMSSYIVFAAAKLVSSWSFWSFFDRGSHWAASLRWDVSHWGSVISCVFKCLFSRRLGHGSWRLRHVVESNSLLCACGSSKRWWPLWIHPWLPLWRIPFVSSGLTENLSWTFKNFTELLENNSLIRISIESSDNCNNFFISCKMAIESEERLNVSMIQETIMGCIYTVENINRVPVMSCKHIEFESFKFCV